MRAAIISDIHGNRRALDAVLADMKQWGPDLVVNLGDCASGPLQAAETMELLMDQRMLSIRGNHDRQLVEHAIDKMGQSDRAAHEQLRTSHLQWLAALPPTMELDMAEAGTMLMCHGTPADDLAYFLEDVTDSGVTLTSGTAAQDRVGDTAARIILCGHSHIQRLVMTPDGQVVVNPGSVGLPAYDATEPVPHVMESGSPHARYAILDTAPTVSVSFRAITYDWHAAAQDARAGGRLDWSFALQTGFAARPSPP